jgi:hypothetical protein
MPYNDFVYLNSKIFQYINRDYTEFNIGGKIERSLDGTGTKDIVTTKRRWSIVFEVDSRQLLRLKSIKDLHSNISYTDWDNSNYTTIWENDFVPKYVGDDLFNIQIDLEQV